MKYLILAPLIVLGSLNTANASNLSYANNLELFTINSVGIDSFLTNESMVTISYTNQSIVPPRLAPAPLPGTGYLSLIFFVLLGLFHIYRRVHK